MIFVFAFLVLRIKGTHAKKKADVYNRLIE